MSKPCKTCGRTSVTQTRKQSSCSQSKDKKQKGSFHLDKKRFGKVSWSSWSDSATTQYDSYSTSETIVKGSSSNDRIFYRAYNKFKRECDIHQYRKWKKYRDWLKFCRGKQINQRDWKKYNKWNKWWNEPGEEKYNKWKEQEVTLDPEEWDKFQEWNKKKPKTKRVYHRSFRTYTKRK